MKIKMNDDKEFVSSMRAALKENDGYCPCALIKSEDTKCMCKEFRDAQSGECRCGLFEKIPD